jgi:hypothetical protein
MPYGEGTYGNQVGRPPKQENAMSAKQALSNEERMKMVRALLGAQFTEQEANRNNDLRQTLGAQFSEQEANRINEGNASIMQGIPNPNLGNPTSRDFADPELDEALRKQRLFYK